MASTVPVFLRLGSEFMPPLYEGTLLYMPITLPGASVQTAQQSPGHAGQAHQQVPEVASVFGKAGRALSATDPAPLEMIETVINLKPETRVAAGDDAGEARGRAGPAGAGARRRQRLDDADQGARRHAVDRHPDAGRHQDLRPEARRDQRHRRADRGRDRERARHAQRVRRARHRRVLHRLQDQARPDRPLRPDRPGRRDGDRVRDRRRERHHDDRGPRALPGERPLPALPTGATSTRCGAR